MKRGRAVVRQLGAAALIVSSVTCASDHATAPSPTVAHLTVVPRFETLPPGGPPIALATVRGVLQRPGGDSLVALAPFQGDSALLTFNVTFEGQSATFTLSLTAYDVHGQVDFAGLDTVQVTQGSNPPPVHSEPLQYAAPDAVVTTLKVTPNPVPLNAGQVVALTAAGTNQSGQPVAVRVGWTSRNPAVATVDTNGVVGAGSFEGQTWVVARTATNIADSASVSVRAPVGSVAISPASAKVAIGDSVQFIAGLADAGNHPITDRTPTWTTSNALTATVSAAGWVKGITQGVVTITAQAEGQSATAQATVALPVASVSVTPSPVMLTAITGTQQLQATPVPTSGVPASAVIGLPVSWSSNNTHVASVDNNGVVTANANGTATITATIDGVNGTTPVVVAQVATSLHASPKPGRLTALKTTFVFHGGAQDARGQSMPDALLKWTSLDPSIASVDSTGTATSLAPGTARIVAASGALADTTTLIVTQSPAFLGASAAPDHIFVGSASQIFPALLDANNQVIQSATFSYASLTPSIVGVNPAGLAIAVAPGVGQIKVMSGGWSTVAQITTATAQWNEPAGLTVLANNTFTHPVPVGDGIAIPGEAPWMISNTGGLATLAPGGGLQYLYQGGVPQLGGSPATTWFDNSPIEYQTLYVRVVWEASSPWTPSANLVTKILYASPGIGGDGDVYLFLSGDASGYTINVEPEFPADVRNLGPNVTSTPLTLGAPHTIEWLLQYNPAGPSSTQWWLDGVLQGSYSIQVPSNPNALGGGLQLYGGYGLNAPAQDQFTLYKSVYVSGKP